MSKEEQSMSDDFTGQQIVLTMETFIEMEVRKHLLECEVLGLKDEIKNLRKESEAKRWKAINAAAKALREAEGADETALDKLTAQVEKWKTKAKEFEAQAAMWEQRADDLRRQKRQIEEAYVRLKNPGQSPWAGNEDRRMSNL